MRIEAEAGRETSRRPCRPIITTRSRPLREIVRALCVVSHNLYADALLKTLGRRLLLHRERTVVLRARRTSGPWILAGSRSGRLLAVDVSTAVAWR